MPNPQGERVETTTEARQGVTGHNVRYVLFFGIAGVLAFAIIYFHVFSISGK